MGVSSSDKKLSKTNIECGGTFDVTLSLTAAPDIVSNPTDIVLILDRSGSMVGDALQNLKNGAKKFVEIIDEATDSSQDGQIGFGSRIGIVSFANTATQDTQLITSVADLNTAIDQLTAGGLTNHKDAFIKATELFDPLSSNAKVMIMFTDGLTTTGGDAVPVTDLAKSQGVIIYCIGLSSQGPPLIPELASWASEPTSAYVFVTPDDQELEEIFEDLAKNIAIPGATDIKIIDTIDPCFKITTLFSPSKGTATLQGTNVVQWDIDELGVTQNEGAELKFAVEHIGPCDGTVEVNESITYTDKENNIVSFPSPEITVDCGIDIYPEPCPQPIDVTIDGCKDSVEFNAGDLIMDSLGRVLQLDVTLKNICPNKRVALAIIVTEVDAQGNEYKRGMKTVTIPAFTGIRCRDVIVRCIKFVLPEDLDVNGNPNSLCDTRDFKVRMFANYIDSDYTCCDILP